MLLDYQWVEAKFKDRPNRFIAYFETAEGEVKAHVPNTGRLRELLVPGAKVLLSYHNQPTRKTQYELRLVHNGATWISIDSQLPNRVVEEGFKTGIIDDFGPSENYKREYTYGNSRFDFCLFSNPNILVEVKGVTLVKEQWGYFPDAPTERGVRHVEELTDALREGWRCGVIFLVQHPHAKGFTPNGKMDPAFANAVKRAVEAGVEVVAWRCSVTPEAVELQERIPVVLWEAENENTLLDTARKSRKRRI